MPYRSSPQSIVDIASGHVDFAFAEAGASLALIRDGKLRALAVSSHAAAARASQRCRRSPRPPARPISKSIAWHMLVRALGTPKPVVERLNGEMKRIMAAPEMQQRISNMGLIPLDPALRPTETERYIKAEVVKWQTILTSIGLAGTQ